MNKKLLADRIRLARDLRDRSLQALAEEIGLNKSTLSRYERGEIDNPKLPVINAIADSLYVNPAWLIGKSDEMTYTHPSLGKIVYSPCNMFSPLRKFRENRGLTPNEVAFRIGINVDDYLAIESGHDTTCTVLTRLAEFFCCSTDTLLSFDGEFSIDDAVLSAGSAAANIELLRKRGLKAFTYEECQLIEKFRLLDSSGRAMVKSMIDHGVAALSGEEAFPAPKEA